MIEQICAFIHNYFYGDRHEGTFTITGGVLELPWMLNGQYFRICGSKLNDGVYKYPATAPQGKPPILADETFEGTIYEMRVPRMFLSLVSEIEDWAARYGEAANSPYQAESVIGVYSYELKRSGTTGGDSTSGWQDVFSARLNEWRKLS